MPEHAVSSAELTGVCQRLAAHYIVLCYNQSEAGLKGYTRLDAERPQCLQLMERCLASKLWQEVQYLAKAIDEYLDRQGYWTERLATLEMCLKAGWLAGDYGDKGWCLNSLGYTFRRRGELEMALTYYKQSLPIHRESQDRKGEGATLNNIATIYLAQGKHEYALEQYQQSLSIWQKIGDRRGEGTTLNNIGEVYRTQGDYEQALWYYEQALPLSREEGDKRGEALPLNNIAEIYRVVGISAKALKYHQQALVIRIGAGDRAGEAESCWNIGLTYKDLGDLASAEEHISQAVQIAERIGHPALEQFRDGLARLRAARQAAQGKGGEV